MPLRLCLLLSALLVTASCKAKVGVGSDEVEAKIKSAFADKGLALASVSCPDGPLSGAVECTGKTADGVDVPITVDIVKESFLQNKLDFNTKGVNVGFVVAEEVARSAKEKYGVDLAVTCPAALPSDQPMSCTGTFDGAEFEVVFEGGQWRSKRGLMTAEEMAATLRKIAQEKNLDVDPATIDCGPAKVYGAVPGRELPCRVGDERVIYQVKPDGSGATVVRSEPIE